MKLVETAGLSFVVPETLPPAAPVQLAFTTRKGGASSGPFSSLNLSYASEDELEAVQENWRRVKTALQLPTAPTYELDQRHTTEVIHLTRPDQGRLEASFNRRLLGAADAVATQLRGPVLALRFADCVPIALYAQRVQALALVHSGWRGTATGAVASAVLALGLQTGATPEEIQAFIFPHIRKECFEIRRDALEVFERNFPACQSVIERTDSEHWHVDLERANIYWLEQLGVTQIETSDLCTACRADLFFSYRRDHKRGCMMLLGRLLG